MADLESDDTSGDAGRRIKKGDRIKATVIQVEKDRVFVNLGTKAEAVVPLEELTDERVESAEGMFTAGDTFDVIVLRAGGPEGAPVVSKRRADFDNQWQKILDSFEEGTVFQAQVVDRVKGGLVVDIGVRGFVPATHVGSGRLRNIERFVGQTLPVKIIEIDRDRKKVVLSNRSAEDERRSEAKQKIFGSAQPQDVLPGVVRRLTDYGAFVDLGGIDGLLHISEMSWVRIDHPREVLKEGDEINVMILRLDPDAGRISLGLRQVLPDPWNVIRQNYRRGQKIQVKITRLVQSGAFVRLPEGAEAFMPVSEMSNRRIKKPTDAVEAGQEVEATIIDLRPDERRMVLSLREGAESMHRGRDQGGGYDSGGRGPARGKRRRKGGRPEPDAASAGGRSPTGGATIGERIGMLKGILPPSEAEPPKKEAKPKAEAPKTDPASPAQAAPTEAKKAEPKPETPAAEQPAAPKPDKPKAEKPAPAEPKATDAKPEKPKAAKPKPEPAAPHATDAKPEKPKAAKPKPEPAEPKATDAKPEKPKAADPKPQEPKAEDPKPDEKPTAEKAK
ncbi:MAG: S1 RNA-binding domain-containing protein [Armatimonadetes bacterium]|nr:S1 RNA-binding domain-containing protein [Armatimonadota bacterium]